MPRVLSRLHEALHRCNAILQPSCGLVAFDVTNELLGLDKGLRATPGDQRSFEESVDALWKVVYDSTRSAKLRPEQRSDEPPTTVGLPAPHRAGYVQSGPLRRLQDERNGHSHLLPGLGPKEKQRRKLRQGDVYEHYLGRNRRVPVCVEDWARVYHGLLRDVCGQVEKLHEDLEAAARAGSLRPPRRS